MLDAQDAPAGQIEAGLDPGGSGGTTGGGAGGFGLVRLSYTTLNGTGYPNAAGESSAVPASTPEYGSSLVNAISRAQVQSLAYDTGSAAPVYTGVSISQTVPGGVIGMLYSTSADGNSWSVWQSNPASLPHLRFIRFQAQIPYGCIINSLTYLFNY